MKFHHQKGNTAIYISIAIALVLILIVPGVALGTAFAYINQHTGAMSPGGSGSLACPSGNYSVVARSPGSIKAINDNMDFYKDVSDATNVPWQVVASVSYRESNLDTNRSMTDGGAHQNGGKENDGKWAMEHLKTKSPGNWNKNNFDAEKIKKALFGYNGAADAYKDQAVKMGFPRDPGYDGSPYVMNNFDEKHRGMGIITHDGGGIDSNDARDGAFTVASLLVNGEFDASGKIIALGGCKSTNDATLVVGDYGSKVIAIAEKEIGYKEGANNMNKYSNTQELWCAYFSSWVYVQAGYLDKIDGSPKNLMQKHSKYLSRERPNGDPSKIQPGDLFYMESKNTNGSGTHAGIIKSVNGNTVTTIEGNANNMVKESTKNVNQIIEVARPIRGI